MDWDLVRKLYNQKLSDTEIASRMGCTPAAVGYWRKKNKLPRWYPEGCIPPDRYEEIESRLRAGELLQSIADDLHVYIETVRKFAIRRRIEYAKPEVKYKPQIIGGTLDRSGYVLLRVKADSEYGYLIRANTRNLEYGYAPLHRMRMHDKLGRKLEPGEVVHHIDGDIYNNSPANLEVYESNAQHLAASLAGKRPNWTPEGWARMTSPKPIPRP